MRKVTYFLAPLLFKQNLRVPVPTLARPARVCLSRYRVKIDALLKLPCFNFINFTYGNRHDFRKFTIIGE